jgi:hypothetical protein
MGINEDFLAILRIGFDEAHPEGGITRSSWSSRRRSACHASSRRTRSTSPHVDAML